ALNLSFRIGRLREVIKTQNVLQCILALVNKRQVIQRQMRNQPPAGVLAGRRSNGVRWLSQNRNAFDWNGTLKLEVSAFVTKRDASRQVAISAGHSDGECLRTGYRRPSRSVHQTDVCLQPIVMRSR